MKRKVLSLLLAFCLIISLIPAFQITALADTVTGLGGSGTAGDPFLIGSASELSYMRDQVNAGGTITPIGGGDVVDACSAFYTFPGESATISLGYWQDSDSDGVTEDGEIYDSASGGTACTSSNWTPIGTAEHPFSGVFYGKGNTISGIYMTSDSDYQGLFGYLSGGVIKQLTLTNSYIKGKDYVGGLVGYCSNTYLTGCYTLDSVSVSGSNYIGGVTGYFYGKNEDYTASMYSVYNDGRVNGNYSVGGLTGYYEGGSDGKIMNASNSGSITGSGTDSNRVGGLIGYMQSGTLSTLSADESGTSIYNRGTVSGSCDVGGLIGRMNTGAISGCYNTGSVSGGDGYTGGIVGTIEGSGVLTKCYNKGALISEGGGGGIVGASNGYIKGCYNEGSVSVSGSEGCFAGGVVGLANTGASGIEYLYCCYNSGTVSGSGGICVGGVAGYLQIGSAGAQYCYNIGNVTGESFVGGVAGKVGESGDNNSSVVCSYNYGCVSGSSYIGGVAGYLSAGSVHDCYNCGSVSGVSYVGAIAGDSAIAEDIAKYYIFSNYYDKQICVTGGINGSDTSAQAEGKLTSELEWTDSLLYQHLIATTYNSVTTDAAYVGTSPINLYSSGAAFETAANVKTNFTVSTANAVSWTSGNTGIVSIDANGNATIKGSGGSMILTVTKGTKSKTVNLTVASAAKAITAFSISGVSGTINETNHTIAVTLPYGTSVTSLKPTITASSKATVSPASGAAKDFTNPVTYTVTAENGTTQDYTVTVTVASGSTGSGGSYSGGGSSSSMGSNINVTTENNTTTATQTFTATTGSDGVAKASVTSSQISEMLASAEKKATDSNAQTSLTIQVEVGSGATGVSVTLPKAAVTSGGSSTLTISSSVATITLDSAALAEIGTKTTGDVTITATAADTSVLSQESRAAIGTRPVYDLKITSGNTTVSDFGGGTATVSVPYKPAAGENVNAIVVYYINASGELVTVPNCAYDVKTGMVTFTTTHFSTYAMGYNKVSFSDVSDNAWYVDYVSYLAARGIVGGIGDGSFSPNASITRAEFVTILAKMSDDDLSGYTSSVFSDVFTDNWYFAAVQWANKAGIASGYDGKFNPNASITREQMVAMLYRYAKYAGTVSNAEGMSVREFSDYNSISNWSLEPIQWAMNNSIISGNRNRSFAPTANATRAETSKMMALLLQELIRG